jgi:hypothetical protein
MIDRFRMRAWDKKHSKMESLTLYGQHMLNDVVLMQATGLKDTFDKLIYEGDILKAWQGPYFSSESTSWSSDESTRHHIIWAGDYPAFDIEPNPFDVCNGLHAILEIADKVLVIGNIYENRELYNNINKNGE